MDYSELISKIRGSLDIKTDLIKSLDFDKYNEHYQNDLTKEEILFVAQKLNVSEEDIYIIVDSILSRYCYYKNGVYVELLLEHNNISESMLGLFRDMIKQQSSRIEKYIQEGKFIPLFVMIDCKIRMSYFKEIVDLIPEEKRYEVFRNIYTSIDFSFDKFNTDELLDSLLKVKPKINKTDKEKVLEKADIDDNGYVTIYRGVGSKSSKLEKSLSWTTNLCVAIKFMVYAKRIDGDIYTAKVHIDDIIDYIDDRDEFEVLVKYNTLKDVKLLDLFDIRDLEFYLKDSYCFWDNYNLLKKEIDYIYDNLDKSEIKNKSKSYRILVLSLIILDFLEEEFNINRKDKIILSFLSVYCSISKQKDEKVLNFIYDNAELFDEINSEEINILCYLIENLYVNEEIAIQNLSKNKNIFSKSKTSFLLNLLKDAIDLDRFKDDNLKFDDLRYDISTKILKISEQIKIFKDFN